MLPLSDLFEECERPPATDSPSRPLCDSRRLGLSDLEFDTDSDLDFVVRGLDVSDDREDFGFPSAVSSDLSESGLSLPDLGTALPRPVPFMFDPPPRTALDGMGVYMIVGVYLVHFSFPLTFGALGAEVSLPSPVDCFLCPFSADSPRALSRVGHRVASSMT